MTRREILLTAAASQRIIGANDRVVVGLIGCGGRGRYVSRFMKEAPNVEFAAVCDVHESTAASAREWAGPQAQAYPDFRKLLERKDIDAVVVATPDHWHAIPTVLACQAGKDVYVEKPLAHNIHEGQAIVKAARDSGRIVQVGTQQRSADHYAELAKIVQSGQLGEVRFVRVWNFTSQFPKGLGNPPDSDPPQGLDWDFYLGPAPKVPFNPARFQRTYRWFWDYAGGFITDFGTHRFDTVHQIMGVDTPRSVSASGGRFTMKDIGEMPDILQVMYEYPGFVMSYEGCTLNAHGLGGRTPGMRYYNARGTLDRPHGEAYYGTNGTIFCDRIGYEIFPEGDRIEAKRKNTTDATSIHAKAFIECVRTRGKPPADAEIGHKSTNIAHLGNIAYKVGRKLQWDGAREEFKNDREATKLLRRQARKPWDMI